MREIVMGMDMDTDMGMVRMRGLELVLVLPEEVKVELGEQVMDRPERILPHSSIRMEG
jgi:hypothetical protein